jgi:uncharacterized protein YacL
MEDLSGLKGHTKLSIKPVTDLQRPSPVKFADNSLLIKGKTFILYNSGIWNDRIILPSFIVIILNGVIKYGKLNTWLILDRLTTA